MRSAGPSTFKPYSGASKNPLILSHVHYAGPNTPKPYCGVTKVPLILSQERYAGSNTPEPRVTKVLLILSHLH